MRDAIVLAFDAEWAAAQSALRSGDPALSFHHLERAHILSQRYTGRHVRVHVAMLRVGWHRRDWREVIGQATRIVAAALFSRIWVPVGNTGGANVSAVKPMPIPEDLRAIIGPPADSGLI